jgi:hypothetical protein
VDSSTNTQKQHSQFLDKMANDYGFKRDTRIAFTERFDKANEGINNIILANSINWNREVANKGQKLQDELKKIYNTLPDFQIEKPAKPGRQSEGNNPWEKVFKWLWETKFPEWEQEQKQNKNKKSINEYLVEEIQPKPDETIFDESEITFRDLYVPLKVRLLDGSGNPIENQSHIELEQWAKDILINKNKNQKILFIQGDAGRGKSVFCRMFADWVRQNGDLGSSLQLFFIPIVIRLRHLKVLDNNLTKTFENYLETYEFVKNPSWLTDKSIRFLFFLDGFDELLLEGRAAGGIKELLQQVEHFQERSHHRFIVTGRPLALQGIDRLINQTQSLERVEIQLMDDSIRQTWLEKWAVKVGQDEANKFQQFLGSCPTDIKDNLAREPLLLYLLARMHKEDYINVQMFAEAKGINAKVRIYGESISWVLEKQRQDQNLRLTTLDKHYLRSSLTEAALCVVQSGNESAKVEMLILRLLNDNNPIGKEIQKATKKNRGEEQIFNSILTSFYIKPASANKNGVVEGAIEFVHKSFNEFLFAERLKESILDWTTKKSVRGQPEREEYLTSTNEMHKQIYDLFGYGNLTREIVDYLMALLTEDKEFKPISLFERLESFYFRWCNGEFIDADAVNEPQSKMQALRNQLPEREFQLGLRQVDMYAGLNVMILLLELNRYAKSQENLSHKIVFHPCRKEDLFDSGRLLRIIGCSHCISTTAFIKIIGSFLSDVDLKGAYLKGANLKGANLGHANLYDANLNGAYLEHAYLGHANLSANLGHANLGHANLEHANLEHAYLGHANLSLANLNGTYLSLANLEHANLYGANLEHANLEHAYLKDADLESAKNLTVEQIKAAKNWEQAKYSPEFRALLGLPPETPTTGS